MIFFQTRFVLSALAAAALSLGAVQAHATGGHHHHPKPPKPPKHDDCGPQDPCDATTKLAFAKLIKVGKTFEYRDTVGGDLTVSASNGGLLINALGQLGVSTKGSILDARVGSNESITFTFEDAVQLVDWDFTDLPWLTNAFTLSIDDGAAQTFSLHNFNAATDLIGSKFTFGYKGDAFLVDSLTFKGYCPPVPEPETYGLALAGLLVAGVALRRKVA